MPLTAKTIEHLAIMFQCFETEPRVDYEKFQRLSGLGTIASAREAVRVAKNKVKAEGAAAGEGGEAGTNSPATTPKKAATPGSKKRSAGRKARGEVDGGEDDVEESLTKKQKVKKEAKADGEDGEGSE